MVVLVEKHSIFGFSGIVIIRLSKNFQNITDKTHLKLGFSLQVY